MTDQATSGAAARHKTGPKGRQRVLQILDAAVRALIDDGYSGFTLRAVAARAGIRPSNLQYYFASKETLLQAILSREFDRSAALLDALLAERQLSPQDRIEAMLDHILADQKDPASCAIFWELWAMAARDAQAAAIMDTYYDRFVASAAAMIADLHPQMSAADRQSRAALIVATLEGASLLRGAGKPDRRELGDFTAAVREQCLDLAGRRLSP